MQSTHVRDTENWLDMLEAMGHATVSYEFMSENAARLKAKRAAHGRNIEIATELAQYPWLDITAVGETGSVDAFWLDDANGELLTASARAGLRTIGKPSDKRHTKAGPQQ
jgi:hypothetical protein